MKTVNRNLAGKLNETYQDNLEQLTASRSSSVGPEGHFSFFHPKVKVKKTISLTSFVFWGLVGLKVLLNFKSFQDLITNVVFYPNSSPPHSCCKGWGWLKNENHGLKCILSHLKPY